MAGPITIEISGACAEQFLDFHEETADDEDESDFDQFARETLNILARHPEQLSGDADISSITRIVIPFGCDWL